MVDKVVYKGPLPTPTPETKPYWDGAKAGKLMLQRCNQCGPYFYPRPFCPNCFSWDVEWFEASGRGKIYSYVISHRKLQHMKELPYIIAIIELEEGPRLMSNIIGVDPDPDRIQCDMLVQVDYVKVTDDVTLPKFRLA